MSHSETSPDDVQPGVKSRRKSMMVIFSLVILAAACYYGIYFYLVARHQEETDDAYVNGNVVQITPQITGTVVAVRADDTQRVVAGDSLVEFDHADAEIALQQAEANLATTVRKVVALFADDSRYGAQIAVRQSDLQRAKDDLNRRLVIAESGAISREEVSHARDSVAAAKAALEEATQQLASNKAMTINTTVHNHPDVKSAAAKVRDAYLTHARNTLPAPVSGIVAKRSVQVGQRVSPGNQLMAIVPLEDVWVDANFKEVQLQHMRVGQPVELHADAYGESVTFHGTVAGFSAGTGSAFALLPAQNATGNWIKVVQRLPVRIALDAKELEAHPLQIGFSMKAKVNISEQQRGQLVAGQNTVHQTRVFDDYGKLADTEIAQIIAANAPQHAKGQNAVAQTLPLKSQ